MNVEVGVGVMVMVMVKVVVMVGIRVRVGVKVEVRIIRDCVRSEAAGVGFSVSHKVWGGFGDRGVELGL